MRNRLSRYAAMLPLLGSNQDSSDPESREPRGAPSAPHAKPVPKPTRIAPRDTRFYPRSVTLIGRHSALTLPLLAVIPPEKRPPRIHWPEPEFRTSVFQKMVFAIARRVSRFIEKAQAGVK